MANPYQGDDVDYFSAVRDEEGNVKQTGLAKSAMPKQSFGQAFAAARKAGDKTFMFNGKKFTTQTKEEAAKSTAKPAAKSTTKSSAKFDKSKAAEVPKPSVDFTKKATEPTKRPMKISEIGRQKMSMEDKMKAIRGMAKGGKVRRSCDGIAKKGKTKGRMV